MEKIRVHHFAQYKAERKPIVMLTAYDGLTAAIFDDAGVDCLLVGDSVGNVMLGHGSTIPVTVDEMVVATRAVTRAVKRAFVVADLPFGAYEAGPTQALENAMRLMKEAGAAAVKLEGCWPAQIELLTKAGIPVVGHLGFTPQSEHALGGFRVQGRGEAGAEIMAQARTLEKAGAVMLVLEMVPAPLAKEISEAITIPTIGIGAGPDCDGQVLVCSDMAGMTTWRPRFAKAFGEVGQALTQATRDYVAAVREGEFPSSEHTFDA